MSAAENIAKIKRLRLHLKPQPCFYLRKGSAAAPSIIMPAIIRISILIAVDFCGPVLLLIYLTSQCLFFMRFLRFGM
jgi:hypothetical protein